MLYAERMIIETDIAGNLKHLPKLPANSQIEAIFLVMGEQSQALRQPHPDIAGKTVIVGDILMIVLDTHIWLWWVNQDSKNLKPDWMSRIQSPEDVGVSAISCFERVITWV